jgi:hypothetical protein
MGPEEVPLHWKAFRRTSGNERMHLPVIAKRIRLIKKRFRSRKMYASSHLRIASGNLENLFQLP